MEDVLEFALDAAERTFVEAPPQPDQVAVTQEARVVRVDLAPVRVLVVELGIDLARGLERERLEGPPLSLAWKRFDLLAGPSPSRHNQIQTKKEYCFPLPAASSPFRTLASYKRLR